MNDLKQFVKKLTEDYPDITCRKTYGLDTFFAKEKIIIAITENSKVALKCYDDISKTKIQEISGIKKWTLNSKVMEDWFEIPVFFNKKKYKLSPLLELIFKAATSPKKKKRKKQHKKKNRDLKNNETVKEVPKKRVTFLSKIKNILPF